MRGNKFILIMGNPKFDKKIEAARRLEAALDLNLAGLEIRRQIKPGSCEQCREPVRITH